MHTKNRNELLLVRKYWLCLAIYQRKKKKTEIRTNAIYVYEIVETKCPHFLLRPKSKLPVRARGRFYVLGFCLHKNLDNVENTIGCCTYRCLILFITRIAQVREHKYYKSAWLETRKTRPIYSAIYSNDNAQPLFIR